MIIERLFGRRPVRAGARAPSRSRSLILVFSEITPKVIGATHADRIAPLVALRAHAAAEAADHAGRLVRQPVRAGAAQAAADPARDRTPAPSSSRRRSCARWCSRASTSAASTARCSPTCSSSRAITRRRRDDAAQPDPRARPRRPSRAAAPAARDVATTRALPVYEDTLDNIVGVLHVKQVVALQQSRRGRRRAAAASCCARPTSCRRARRCSTQLHAVPERPRAPGRSSSTSTASSRA